MERNSTSENDYVLTTFSLFCYSFLHRKIDRKFLYTLSKNDLILIYLKY